MTSTNPLDETANARSVALNAIWIRALGKLLVSKGVFTKEELVEALYAAEKFFWGGKDKYLRQWVKQDTESIEKYWTNV